MGGCLNSVFPRICEAQKAPAQKCGWARWLQACRALEVLQDRSVVLSKAPALGAPGAAWHLTEALLGVLCSCGAGQGGLVAAGASGYEYLMVIQLWVLAAGGKV